MNKTTTKDISQPNPRQEYADVLALCEAITPSNGELTMSFTPSPAALIKGATWTINQLRDDINQLVKNEKEKIG